MDLSVVPYGVTYGGAVAKYGECMRNHAAAMGGQAYDGCGEFMPGGDGGSLEALKCAACGCHRNFHRREGPAGPPRRPLALPPPPLGFPAAFLPQPMPYQQIGPLVAYGRGRAGSETPPRRGEEEERRLQAVDSAARSTKRHRTKFTAEQKKKMQAFAERLGWRICKHDDVALREFCLEVGVKRNVLKVWMHNNKNSNSNTSTAVANHDGPGAGATAQPISV